MEYEPEYTEKDKRIEELKERLVDLEEVKKNLEHGIELMEGNPDYDDLLGMYKESLKECDRLIDYCKEEIEESLEEPNLYDEYDERNREYREQQGF